MIPEFTPAYLPENSCAIDASNFGLIAYATGNTINLATIQDQRLFRNSPIIFPTHAITVVKFHPDKRLIAAGDSRGQIFFWDFDHRLEVGSVRLPRVSDACLSIDWKDNVLIALFDGRQSHPLAAFTFPTVESRSRLLWDLELPTFVTKFMLEPHFGNFILLSGTDPTFSIFRFVNPLEKPIFLTDPLQVPGLDEICDAQWSAHLPGYVLLVSRDSIWYFHVDAGAVISIVPTRMTGSVFSFLVQLPDDITGFLVFLRNGGIALFRSAGAASFQLASEIKPVSTNGTFVSACVSPLERAAVLAYHSALGVAIFDIISQRLTAMDLVFPSKILSFDCDGTNYALGTDGGFVISGSVFDPASTRRYLVGKTPVKFVSFNGSLSRIHWQTQDQIGFINLVKCEVEFFNTRGARVLQCFGSRHGAFIVQRDYQTLGVFVEGKERPLLVSSEIADVGIDHFVSKSSLGVFALLLKNQEIQFYEYSKKGIRECRPKLRPKGQRQEPLCLAVSGTRIATGFAGGLIVIFDTDDKTTACIETGCPTLRKLRFSSTGLFGLGRESTIFAITHELSVCPFPVSDYVLVDDGHILAKGLDGVVRFASAPEWLLLPTSPEYLPIPTERDRLQKYVIGRTRPFFHPLARDIWLCVLNQHDVRLQAKTGCGRSGLFEKLDCDILATVSHLSSKVIRLKFTACIFADRFAEAGDLLMSDDPTSRAFMETTLFSVILFQAGQGVSEEVHAVLKSTGFALFETNQFDLGALLFRIGKLDKLAVEYLIGYGQDELAMRFMRSCLDESEKRKYAFIFGCKKLEQNRFAESTPFFACSGEYLPILAVLMNLGMVTDAYYLLKYLESKGTLHEVPEDLGRYLSEPFAPLADICGVIESQFRNTLSDLGLSPSDLDLEWGDGGW
jgi:hypothetical protein